LLPRCLDCTGTVVSTSPGDCLQCGNSGQASQDRDRRTGTPDAASAGDFDCVGCSSIMRFPESGDRFRRGVRQPKVGPANPTRVPLARFVGPRREVEAELRQFFRSRTAVAQPTTTEAATIRENNQTLGAVAP